MGTPGLTPLDEEREASLADEGGASGAVVESLPVGHLQSVETPRGRPNFWVFAGVMAAGAISALSLRRRR